MPEQWNLNAISQSFAEAATGQITWRRSLDLISEQVGGSGATIVPLKGLLPERPTSSAFEEAIDVYVKDGWYKHDDRFRAMGAVRRKGFGTDLDFISEEEMRRSPYYQEWLRPFGLKWFAGVLISGLEEEWALSLQRSEAQGPFTDAEGTQLALLSRGLASSAMLANALGFARADAALDAFTASGKAVILFNRHGEIIRANPAAEELFTDSFRIRQRRIVCPTAEETTNLARAIQKACDSRIEYLDLPVLLKRPNKTSIIAYVSRSRGVAIDVLSPCQGYVIFVDPYRRGLPTRSVLMDSFGLTGTEASVADMLRDGRSLRQISTEIGISYETGRTHLRNIFSKLDVHDQADLVAFLVQLRGS